MRFLKIAHDNVQAGRKVAEITKEQAEIEIMFYIDNCANWYYDDYVSPVQDSEDDIVISKAYEKAYGVAFDDIYRVGSLDIGDYDIVIEKEEV